MLLADQKVAGILVERVETATGPAAVVGVGLNVHTRRDELPVPTATSLALAGATGVDRTVLLIAILRTLQEEYDAWQAGRAAELRASYTRACVSIGRQVRVELPSGETLTGTAVAIDVDGRDMIGWPRSAHEARSAWEQATVVPCPCSRRVACRRDTRH